MKRLNPRGNGDTENFVNTRATVITYMECQKNHAEARGGHAVDGCQEFMASGGEEDTTPTSTCAACGCTRSFHRRLVTALPT